MAGPDTARRLVTTSVTAAWIAYSSWILAFVLPCDVDNSRAWVSELGAAGQPYHTAYRLGDRLSGLLLALSGLLILSLSRRFTYRTRWWPLLGGLYTVGGIGLEIEAFSPLPCAPSLDTACRDRLLGANPTLVEDFHAAASFVEAASLLGALACTWWMIRARSRVAWWALAALIVLSLVGESMSGLGLWWFTGTVQRAALGGLAASGVWGTAWLMRHRLGPGGSGRPPADPAP